MRPVLADDFFAMDDAGAIDESLQSAETIDRRGDRRLPARLVGDVGADEARAAGELLRERLALRFLEVRDDGVAAAGDDHSRRGRAQPRRAAGNDERAAR